MPNPLRGRRPGALLALSVVVCLAGAGAGCRMATVIESPHIHSSEFGQPLARAGAVNEGEIASWEGTAVAVEWPATIAVLQVHRDNRYVAHSQDEWDAALRSTGALKGVNVVDGLGIGDEAMHESVARHIERKGPNEAQPHRGKLFVPERWLASASRSNLLFIYATKVTTDSYWNLWAVTYPFILTAPFLPAEEQTAQAIAKGFLVDVKTGKILETAGAVATQSRSANPIIITRPMFQLEQQVAREAEKRMIEQVAQKILELKRRAG